MKDIVYWGMHVGIVPRNINTDLFNSQIIIVVIQDISFIIYRFNLNAFKKKIQQKMSDAYVVHN